jgi:hypothetical protein
MADITGSIHERYVAPRRVKILASLLTCSSDTIELISSALLLRLKIETRLLARDVSIRSNRRVVSLRNED